MTAKEMFEVLGFKLVGNCSGFTYCRKDFIVGDFHIRFDNNYKIVEYYHVEHKFPTDSKVLSTKIMVGAKLYKAITQQMKELGWVE